MEAPINFSLERVHSAIGLSRDAIADTIEHEECSEMYMSIADALTSGIIAPTQQSAYGRTDIHPSTVKSLQATGILPLSKTTYLERATQRKCKDILQKIKTSNKTLHETKGFRVRLAYRLIRYMARIRGGLPGFSKLETALQNIWHVPQKFDMTTGYSIGTKGIRSLLHTWSTSDNTFTYHDGNRIKTVKGITYLPPQIPDSFFIADGARNYEDIWRMRSNRIVPQSYDITKDEPLHLFCESMEMLADRLHAYEGTEVESEAGIEGIAGLLTPQMARIAWPTVDELIMYEDELIMYIYDEVIQHSDSINTEKEIMRRFGVERQEAMDLYKMSQEVGSLLYREDMEQARQTMINRLGRLADAAESYDIRASLTALDRQSKLKGLTRTEETSEMDELRQFATRAVEFKERDEK